MAKKNSSVESPSFDVDDDPTAELEALPGVAPDMREAPPEIDEHTSRFDSVEAPDEVPAARLRDDLRAREQSISKLQFDIEQLRSRWTGLEKEIKVREQLTDDQNAELRKLRQALAERDRQFNVQSAEVEALNGRLQATEKRLHESDDALDAAQSATETGDARIKVLELQQSSDAATIALHEKELRELRADVRKYKELAAAPAQEIIDLKDSLRQRQADLDDLRQYVDGRKSDWQAREGQLRDKDLELEQQARRIRELGIKLDTSEEALAEAIQAAEQAAVAEPEVPAPPPVIMYTGNAEVRELQAQILRTERYADSLRQRLHDAGSDAGALKANHEQLRETLQEALEHSRDLAAQLEEVRLGKSEVARRHEHLQQRFDDEIGGLRNELDASLQRHDEQRGENVQLAASLAEHRDARSLAESAAAELRQQADSMLAETKERQEKNDRAMAALQDALADRDATIAALRDELANQTGAGMSIDEIGNAILELDDRMQASIRDRSLSDKDRSTRLLVGELDGQELRFPLFKDRLTVGRSRDNDIQLNMPSVSRHHAVITCDAMQCRIEDNGSKNGIWVNDEQVRKADLKNGDRIGIGTATLDFEERMRR